MTDLGSRFPVYIGFQDLGKVHFRTARHCIATDICVADGVAQKHVAHFIVEMRSSNRCVECMLVLVDCLLQV